jgi:TonB-dependent receptor
MFIKQVIFIVLLSCLVLVPGLLWSQSSGRVGGIVFDASNNQPLLSAIVLLKGTSLGASTGLDGTYTIRNVPPGSYTIRVSYIGYEPQEVAVDVQEGASLTRDFKMVATSLQGQEVVVTAQALGQNAAINQQLASNKIVNVVSAARIQELPDANAAESVGRLPGVSIIRSGGEGIGVVIRGLEPKYNEIMIDGIEMAATNTTDRGTDLSMISQNMLEGIEVFKTATPDLDAAFLGGVVNFQIRKPRPSVTGAPSFGLLAQGGYDRLHDSYSNYRLVGSVEDRLFDENLGYFVEAIVERADRTSDELGGNYDLLTKNFGVVNPTILNSLNLYFKPRDRQRYDGTVVLDYRLPEGKLALMNVFSESDTKTESRNQTYSISGNSISYGEGYTPNTLNTLQNILQYQQHLFSVKVDARISHAYSENISPNNWSVSFLQGAAGTGAISRTQNPILIAQQGLAITNFDNLQFNGINTSSSFGRERNIASALDLEKSFNVLDFISADVKVGGQYKYTYRDYNYDNGSGTIYFPGNGDARAAIIAAFPWMAQAPYNINPNGTQNLPITVFEDPKFSYGKFLGGDYTMNPGTNFGLLSQVVNIVSNIGKGKPFAVSGDYSPDVYGSVASDYSGKENRSAGYAMATFNIGPAITFIPGVRYQALATSYTTARYDNASAPNPYPYTLPHKDTTINEYHGYWLPDVTLRLKPLSWFDVRLAYTNTISYPDFGDIIPRIDIFTSSVTWNNAALKPARSENYDLQASLYDNSIGLLTVGGFLKRINDMIFSTGTRYITDPSAYPGLPAYTNSYTITTSINDPYRVDVWGAEVDWQTHFWYLPWNLDGIVFNVNYTHIFSGAKYPFTLVNNTGFPRYQSVYVDTFYTDRLVSQPNDIVNGSLGYDFQGFSMRVSLQYQSNIFNRNNFWPELRSYKNKYLRWDLQVKQDLPWYGLEAFFDINNLNSESDIYIIQGSGFPTSAQDYGLTADIGLRCRL